MNTPPRRPTKATIQAMKEDLIRNLDALRRAHPDPDADEMWAEVETFCALALRVMAKTNTSKIRDELMTVEISARLAGRTVYDPD